MSSEEKNSGHTFLKTLPLWVWIVFGIMAAAIVALSVILGVVLGRTNSTPASGEAQSSSYVTESKPDNGGASADNGGNSSDNEDTSADNEDNSANNSDNSTVNEDNPDDSGNKPDDNGSSSVNEDNPANSSDKPADNGNTSNSTDKPANNGSTSNSNKPAGNPQENKSEYLLEYSIDSNWETPSAQMYGIRLAVTNSTGDTVSGWKLTLQIDGLESCEGWNGTYTANGDTLTITNAEYNGDIYAGGTVVIGCNLGTTKPLRISSAKLNGKNCRVSENNSIDQNNQNNNPPAGQGSQGGSNSGTGEAPFVPQRTKDAVQGDDWLHTDGNRILDKNGKQVWLTGVNWFGYNTGTNCFDGLWASRLKPSVEAIADHGFNLIRVPISAQLINQWAAGEYPRANYNNAYNPELNSMNSLEIFDYFLILAEENGIKVMPDIHSAETNASGHNVNLWYTASVTAEDYYHALEWLAERYKDNDTIIAFDLKNEPHGKPFEGSGAAIWNDSTSPNNWKYTAEQAAARILAKNPNVLILVEGTEIYPIDIKANGDFHSTNEKDYYFNWWAEICAA